MEYMEYPRNIPKNKPWGLYFSKALLRCLFLAGRIVEGAHVRREICAIKSVGPACSGKEMYHFCFVLLCIRGQIPSTSRPEGA